jgi:hypothetical protein
MYVHVQLVLIHTLKIFYCDGMAVEYFCNDVEFFVHRVECFMFFDVPGCFFYLNAICEEEILVQDTNVEVEEVNPYQNFEEIYRTNEAVADNVGIMENIFEFDLNVEPVENSLPEVCEVQEEAVELDADDANDPDYYEYRVREPIVGDEFDSIDDAHSYYQLYGMQSSFGICKRSSHKVGNVINHYVFACSKFKKRVVSNNGHILIRRSCF